MAPFKWFAELDDILPLRRKFVDVPLNYEDAKSLEKIRKFVVISKQLREHLQCLKICLWNYPVVIKASKLDLYVIRVWSKQESWSNFERIVMLKLKSLTINWDDSESLTREFKIFLQHQI